MIKKYFTLNNKKVFGLGLGTFGYGEQKLIDEGISEEEQIKSLVYTLNRGVNYVVGYLTYANGKAVELLARAIKESKKNVYLTFCAYPHNYTSVDELKSKFIEFLKTMDVKKVDTFMVSSQMEGRFGTQKTLELMNTVLKEGLAGTLGLNNYNLEQLNNYYSVFGNTIILHEICHNFEVRIFEDMKIIEKGQELGIQHIGYQPLRRNKTSLRNWPLLVSLAKTYGKTQNQIILNWLNQSNILTLIKAADIKHVEENMESLDFEIKESDIELLNSFRPNWKIPNLNWDNFNSEDALYVAKLSNVFDELYR